MVIDDDDEEEEGEYENANFHYQFHGVRSRKVASPCIALLFIKRNLDSLFYPAGGQRLCHVTFRGTLHLFVLGSHPFNQNS